MNPSTPRPPSTSDGSGPSPGRHPHGWIAAHDPLPVLRWDVDRRGHSMRSPYLDRFWLPVLGPTGVLVWRRLADDLAWNPHGFDVSVELLAVWLGVGSSTSKNAPVVRALARLVGFGLADVSTGVYRLCCVVPDAPAPRRPLPGDYIVARHAARSAVHR